jgi:uncharacterized membrane protein
MKLDAKELLPFCMIAVMFLAAYLLHPAMPERMPVHWGVSGQIDGYGSRFIGVWLLPIITASLYLLLTVMPFVAVWRKNIERFYFFYFAFKTIFVFSMVVLYAATILPNFGLFINMNYFMAPWLAVIIFASGSLMLRTKRNFFAGVRTQWTLADDYVWKKTNDLGGRGFQLIAFLMLLGIFITQYALLFFVALLLVFAVYLVVYSYLLYKKRHR